MNYFMSLTFVFIFIELRVFDYLSQDFLQNIIFNMSQVDIATVEKNFDSILETVGQNAYVDWEKFTKSSSQVAKTIEELSKSLAIFREVQQKNFIQSMKKLKSLDLPDLIKTVKAKKLPKQALRTVLSRFQLDGEKLTLIEPAQTLKEAAVKQFAEYNSKNQLSLAQMKRQVDFYNQKIKQSGYQIQRPIESRQMKSTVKFELAEDQAQSMAAGVDIQYLPNTQQLIGIKTYSQIVDKSYDLLKNQYQRITSEARAEQRKIISQPKKYLDFLNEYLNNTEALIFEAQKLLGTKVGLKGKKLEQSEVALMQRGLGQQILILQSNLRARVKQSIPSSKDVSLDVAKQVIGFQTEMINKKSDELKQFFSHMQKTQESVQLIPMLLSLILNDWVFEKYGYEQEDFMKNVGQQAIQTTPDLIQLFRDMQLSIIRLMQKLEIIPEDVVKYMEQSAQMRGQPEQLPQQQISNMGMMPGSNPMDLLQMQQMQQMQQMFQSMNQK